MTRGERNCNPLNIRKDGRTVWEGQTEKQTDPDFVQFTGPEYGFRAGVRILRQYQRQGVNTLRGAISHWAPPAENATDSYIADVCADCAVDPDDVVVFDDIMFNLLKAICLHENGEIIYSDAQIQMGIELA